MALSRFDKVTEHKIPIQSALRVTSTLGKYHREAITNFSLPKQRVCLKFCVANKILSASSRTVVEDLCRSGCPSRVNTDENVTEGKEIVLEDPHTILRDFKRFFRDF